MWRNAAKCGAFWAHFGPIRAILGCFEMRRNAAADPNAAHFGAFRRHARRIMQLRPLEPSRGQKNAHLAMAKEDAGLSR